MDRNNKGRFIKGFKHPPTKKEVDVDFCIKKYKDGYSCFDICKKFKVSEATIRNRFKEMGFRLRKNNDHTNITKKKISDTNKKRGIQPKERFSGEVWNKGLTQEDERVRNNIRGLLENRKTQVLPKKDTSIEIKMQNFLKQLGIEFFTHQYIKEIEHGYQCDIMIPVQKGITQKTIIECDGDYWHNHPYGREIDNQRCQELRKKGWRVLAFWECEIRNMELNNLQEKLI